MDSTSNKKQVEATLRQLGVPFSPDASKEELLRTLQHENQRQWMKLAENKRVLRRKGPCRDQNECRPPSAEQPPVIQTPDPRRPHRPSGRTPDIRTGRPRPRFEKKTERKPAENIPDPTDQPSNPLVHSVQYLENYAFERAHDICELCDTPAKQCAGRLTAFFFNDRPDGKPRTTKDVAVLCPDCLTRFQSNPVSKDIKILKRKARRSRISEVKITRV